MRCSVRMQTVLAVLVIIEQMGGNYVSIELYGSYPFVRTGTSSPCSQGLRNKLRDIKSSKLLILYLIKPKKS